MIIKKTDEPTATDKFSRAGYSAENKMQFYLKREFEDANDIYVLNGIRVGYENDYAQIDHLIIYKYVMILIESKSVIGNVYINDFGEWSRLWDSVRIGIPSPIEQAKRQSSFLKKYLESYGPKLPRALGIPRKYEELPIEILVAISDTAIISRPKELKLDSVFKADQIVDKINQILDDYYQEKGFFSSSIRPFTMNLETIRKISLFLKENHTPLIEKTSTSEEISTPVEPSLKPSLHTPALTNKRTEYRPVEKLKTIEPGQTDNVPRCRVCGSKKLKVLWGRYGYYYKCDDCNNNTPIKQSCVKCGQKLRVRKDKNNFFSECASCKTSILFHKNPT